MLKENVSLQTQSKIGVRQPSIATIPEMTMGSEKIRSPLRIYGKTGINTGYKEQNKYLNLQSAYDVICKHQELSKNHSLS